MQLLETMAEHYAAEDVSVPLMVLRSILQQTGFISGNRILNLSSVFILKLHLRRIADLVSPKG